MSKDSLAIDEEVEGLRVEEMVEEDMFAAKAEKGSDGEGSRMGGKRKDSPVEIDLREGTKRRGGREKPGSELSGKEVRRSRRLTVGRK
jgi:hypothetical protein